MRNRYGCRGETVARLVVNEVHAAPEGIVETEITHRETEGGNDMSFGELSGESANAIPHTQKWRRGVTHIWGNPRGQPTRSAMGRPHPRASALVITDSSRPGKYKDYAVCLLEIVWRTCELTACRPVIPGCFVYEKPQAGSF